MISFYTYCLGCRTNRAELNDITYRLVKKGYSYNKNNPDFVILNTCVVTQKAEREVRQTCNQIRKKYPCAKLILIGCAASYWSKIYPQKKINADIIIDNSKKSSIVSIIFKNFPIKSKAFSKFDEKLNSLEKFGLSKRKLIKICDGCDRFCTYCIVPYLRGLPVSKKIADIIKEIKAVKPQPLEIILTAINSESFGKDTGETLEELVKRIIDETSISRISFGSLHPCSITNEFISLYSKKKIQKRLVHFFHIPIQSANNKILNLMRRGYLIESVLNKILQIQKVNPLVFLSTDVMVGFIDETNDDFQKTYLTLKSSPFVRFHIFRYSPRINTYAYFSGKLKRKKIYIPTEKEKIERSETLRKLCSEKFRKFQESLINIQTTALILPQKKGKYNEVLLSNQMSALVYSKSNTVGTIQKVIVKDFLGSYLYVKIL